MSDAPPVVPPPIPKIENWYRQMARASWLAPLVAIVVNFMLFATQGITPGKSDPVRAVLGVVFIFGGLVLGIVALFGVRKYGSAKILVPAFIGIGINLFLIVMGTLPVLYLAKKRAQLQPAVHSPMARLLKDDRLSFSMDIPDGFRDFPEGKRTPNVEYVFIKEIADAGDARMVITVERLNGTLPKNQPLTVEDIRKRMPPGSSAKLADQNWRGLKVDAIVAEVPQGGIRMVVYTIQIPVVPSAIQLAVAGPESNRAQVEKLANALLASLEGDTNW